MTKQIVKDEILFTHKLDTDKGFKLSLKRQSYSDGTCFYTLVDQFNVSNVEHSSEDLNDLISQIKHEMSIHKEHMKRVNKEYDNKSKEIIQKTSEKVTVWKTKIINDLQSLSRAT